MPSSDALKKKKEAIQIGHRFMFSRRMESWVCVLTTGKEEFYRQLLNSKKVLIDLSHFVPHSFIDLYLLNVCL